jgi:oligoribonuclease
MPQPTAHPNPIKLAFLDLETGGLDGMQPDGRIGAVSFPILEIAMHITDSELNIVDGEGLRLVIHVAEDELAQMSPWSIEQHAKSGLLDEVRRSALTLRDAEALCIEHMQKHGAEKYDRSAKTGTIMAGNSIRFDRNYLNAQMPLLDSYFHYRQIDVSSIDLLNRIWRPEISARVHKDYKHLALSDIRETINEIRLYKETLWH